MYVKHCLAVFLLAALTLTGYAQTTSPCPQWKNPTSFTTGSSDYYWTARVGERCYPKNMTDTTTGYYVMSTCASSSCTEIKGNSNITDSKYDSPTEDDYWTCGDDFFDLNGHRFQIITLTKNNGIDSLTIVPGDTVGMPRIPPGYTSSIRLGDIRCASGSPAHTHKWSSGTNKGSESLFYTMYVTPENALLFINYAVVARRFPHTAYDAGEYLIRVVKQTEKSDGTLVWDTVPINDNLWYKVSAPNFTGSQLPKGWQTGAGDVNKWPCTYAFKPWTKVAVNLNDYLYTNVRVEMYTSDCIYAADPVYAYVCGDYAPMIIQSAGCPSPESDVLDTLSAPEGLNTYKWFAADRGAVDEEYLFNHEYLDTVAFHQIFPEDGGDTTYHRYNAKLSDFVIKSGPNAGDTASMQTFKCVMTSALNPEKPFESQIYANVENRRPLVMAEFESLCGGTVNMYNRSVVFAASGADDDSTHWVVYDDAQGLLPLDTIWGTNVSYKFTTDGDHAIKLFVTTAGNEKAGPCTAAETFVVTAKLIPPATFDVSKRILCENETLQLTASDSVKNMQSSLKLTWVIDGDTLEETTPDVHKVLPVGTHNISLTVQNAAGCINKTTDQVMVMGQPIISLGSDIEAICVGDSVSLSADGTINYTWNSAPTDPNLDTTRQGAVVVYPQQTTTYYLVPAGNTPCEVSVASVKIEVVPTPVPTIRSSAPRVNKEDPMLTFLDVSNDAKWSHWSFSDGGIAEGQRVDHSFSNLDDDSVYVTLQSCNRLNCCADTTIGLPVEVTTVWFANMFTPDREDNNRFGMVTTLTLLEYELYIYNRNGQLVWHTTDQNELWDGKTSDGGVAPQGTYAYFCRYSYVKDSYHTTNGNITLVR